MSDQLKDLMRMARDQYEAYGVGGTEGARAMREGLARIEVLEAQLKMADELADILGQADKRIAWETFGFGNDFADTVERTLATYRKAQQTERPMNEPGTKAPSRGETGAG